MPFFLSLVPNSLNLRKYFKILCLALFIYVYIYMCVYIYIYIYIKLNSVALVRERTIPTERPPPVGEVSANFCG